jgi:hypothetical protein
MNYEQPNFYLADTDMYHFDAPAKAWRVKTISRDVRGSNTSKPRNAAVGDSYLLVRVDPPFESPGRLIDKVLLSAKGAPIIWSAIDRWPVFVFVLYPHVQDIEKCDLIGDDEFVVLDWAALFQNMEEARKIL